MKKSIFLLALLVISGSVIAQSESKTIEKKAKYGINLGVNYSNLVPIGDLPDISTISNGLGFQLGVLAEYRIASWLSLSPRAGISFNDSNLNINNIDGSSSAYDVLPVTIDLMAHAILRINRKDAGPYVLVGLSHKNPISKNPDISSEFPSGDTFAVDLGIGLEKAFRRFQFAPELRYSFGISKVDRIPVVRTLNYHQIALVFNFLG